MRHRTIKAIVLGFCTVGLSSCMVYDDNLAGNYQTYAYNDNQLYPKMDYSSSNAGYQYQLSEGAVRVPDSYHVGEFHSPVSFKDRDKTWVTGQNPQAYTIELADGEKASQVAQKLYKTPKNDRMAQIKYQRNGKDYYKGVYGTYPDAQSAQKALEGLPEDIKKGAGVKNWGSVQNNLE